MGKYQEINYMLFEVIHPKCTLDEMIRRHTYDYRGHGDLFDVYDNPSASKREIWHDWQAWANETPCVKDLHIERGSMYSFSIGAYHVNHDTGDIDGYFYITKDHNRLYLFD